VLNKKFPDLVKKFKVRIVVIHHALVLTEEENILFGKIVTIFTNNYYKA